MTPYIETSIAHERKEIRAVVAVIMSIVVLGANVLGASMAAPQAHRLVRTKRTDGLSSAWVGVSIAMNTWWLAYGVANEVWVVVPVSAVSLALYVTIATVMWQQIGHHTLRGLGAGAVAIGVVPAIALAIAGWEVAGVVIGLGYGAQLAPAVVVAFRTDRLAGVSPGTWMLAFLEAALWLVYGAYVADSALLVGGAMGVALSGLILGRLLATGHLGRRTAWEPA